MNTHLNLNEKIALPRYHFVDQEFNDVLCFTCFMPLKPQQFADAIFCGLI